MDAYPILEEVWRIGDELAREAGFSSITAMACAVSQVGSPWPPLSG